MCCQSFEYSYYLKKTCLCVCVFYRMVWASLAALTVCCSAHSCPVGGGVARKAPTTSDVSIPVIWRDIQISLKTCRFKELVGGGGSRAHFSLQRSSSWIKGPQSAQVSVIFTMCLYGVVSYFLAAIVLLEDKLAQWHNVCGLAAS